MSEYQFCMVGLSRSGWERLNAICDHLMATLDTVYTREQVLDVIISQVQVKGMVE